MSALKGLLLCALLSASAMALPRIAETSAHPGDEERIEPENEHYYAQVSAEIEEVIYKCPAVAILHALNERAYIALFSSAHV